MLSLQTERNTVPVRGMSSTIRAGQSACRTGETRLISSGKPMEARQPVNGAAKRGQAGQAADSGDGPFSVECGEQDRREGSRFGPCAFPRHRAETGLCGALRAALAGHALAGRRRAGPARRAGEADRTGGSLPADGGRHVAAVLRGRGLPQARPGRAHHGQRLHPRADGHFAGSGLVGRGHFFQIWEPSRFARHAEGARERLRSLRRTASMRQAGEPE